MKRHYLLYIHCLLEGEVIKDINRRALTQLRNKPNAQEGDPSGEAELTTWRAELKSLMDVMVNYSLSINIPVSSTLSDYQSLYCAIREALYIDQLRDDLESGIKLIYEVYEAEMRLFEERQEKRRWKNESELREQREVREKRQERRVNLIISALTPMMLITGIFGMNNFDSSKFTGENQTSGLWESLFYNVSIGRSLIIGIVLFIGIYLRLNRDSSK